MLIRLIPCLLLYVICCACTPAAPADAVLTPPPPVTTEPTTIGEVTTFLSRYDTTLAVLTNPSGQLLVSPRYQGKVFTAALSGGDARPLGWINYEAIAADTLRPHINAFGGESRYWIGPEGGQYSVFFPPGSAFTFDNWQTPPAIDSEAWAVTAATERSISLRKAARMTNHSGTDFDLRMERSVSLLDAAAARNALDLDDAAFPLLAYTTDNRLTNTGAKAWNATDGGLSIWILDMFPAGDSTVVVLPHRQGTAEAVTVRDDYFGKVPGERLAVNDEAVLFAADGRLRSKIGLPPGTSDGRAASVDLATGHVIFVRFDVDADRPYPRQEWRQHADPYAGDAVNSYNDGPLEPGGEQLGAFYEIESVSPAAFLAPGETASHEHTVYHLSVPPALLDTVLPRLLGTDVATLRTFLKRP